MTPQEGCDGCDSRKKKLADVCSRLPKVELHAHFFGSIRPSTIRRIAARKAAKAGGKPDANACTPANVSPPQKQKPDLDVAFRYFSWVYSVVKRTQDIQKALFEVLEDFHKDNVVYLELRSSLKRIPEEGVDPQSYVDLLVGGCRMAEERWGLTVRLIVSLDRARMTSEEDARLQIEDAFEAASRHPEWIVGFDIAGRPDKGNLDFTLRRLREEVMAPGGRFFGKKKLTVHTAEVEADNEDARKILDLPPHRLGHGLYLAKQQAVTVRSGICVEVCPTSNMCTTKIKDMCEHPLALQLEGGVHLRNVCICTDDIGLFQTSLSNEMRIVAQAYSLSPSELFELQRFALTAAFCSEEVKSKLKDKYFSDSAKKQFVEAFAASV
ncbi:hypothetical protein Efla_000661 [Eimeria flavescens]